MKDHHHRVSIMTAALISGVALVPLGLEAKPGKGKGGPPAHAQKGKPGKANKGKETKGKPAHAGGPQKAKGSGPRKGADVPRAGKREWNDERRRRSRFVDRDRSAVLEYFGEYRDRDHGLPPGLAKNLRRGKPLPPGWRKKITRGSVIGDAWWSSFVRLPYSRFPSLDSVPDTGLYWYGDRLYRVYEPRREVVDVIVVPTIHIDF